MKIAALIMMVFVFSSYLIATAIKGKKAHSISASFYNWGSWKRGWFRLMLFGISIPVFAFLEIPWNNWNYLLIAGIVSLMLVSTFADFKGSKFEELWHVIPSYTGIFFTLLSIGFIYHNWYMLAGFLITALILLLLKVKDLTWWHEVAAFIWAWFGLLITIL